MRPLLALVALAVVLALPSSAPAEEVLRYETRDWILTAPASIFSVADLELVGKATQICNDEIVLLTGYRPPRPVKFTVQWIIGSGPSGAGSNGFVNFVPATYRIVSDNVRPFWEERVARGTCFGPHEVTHVLTWSSWGQAWANEGFAEFTDRLYDSTEWECCTMPLRVEQTCDATGFTVFGQRYSYADLSDFRVDLEHYGTAACFWIEVQKVGGFPALRGILASMRYRRPATTGELVAHHVNRVLNADLRPIVARFGFEPHELEAGPTPAIPGCTLIGMATPDVIAGTAGTDVICGLGGNDRLTGGRGIDTLNGGTGNDTLDARDGRRDVVRGGPGRDTARIDPVLDRVTGVERIRR